MKLYYLYNNHCGSCKGYETEVNKLSTELKLTPQKQNIDEIKPIVNYCTMSAELKMDTIEKIRDAMSNSN